MKLTKDSISIRKLIWAFIQSVLFLALSYFSWTFAKEVGGDSICLSAYIFGENYIKSHRNVEKEMDSDVLVINVGYDKKLVSAHEYGIEVGETTITDREKLYSLLNILSTTDSYKYILLDINFDTAYKQEIDSLLYPLIASMRDIVVPSNITENSIDSILMPKSGIAEYLTTAEDLDFHKYKYAYDNQPSIALKMWKDINHGVYTKKWYGYKANGRLCNNNCRISFPFAFSPYTQSEDSTIIQNYMNLGVDILYLFITAEEYNSLFDNKMIIIGDLINDSHDTMVGSQAGPIINYNAYLTLRDGKNITPIWVWLSMFLTWFVASLLVFGFFNNSQRANTKKKKFIFIREVALELIGISFFVTLFCFIVYVSTQIIIRADIIIAILSFEKIIINAYEKTNTSQPNNADNVHNMG